MVKFRHVYPFILFPLPIIGVIAVGLTHCSRLGELAEISPDDIPDVVLQNVEGRDGLVNVVWRACYEQDGYVISVVTYEYRSFVAPRFNPKVEWIVSQQTELGSKIVLRSAMEQSGDAYAWQTDTRSGIDFGDYVMLAVGWARDARAHTVVGTTALRGRQFEAPIVNGFWFLRVMDHEGPEIFDSAVVKDEQGNVIYEYPALASRP